MTGHCHIQLGVIQHSKGNSALKRLAYQGCGSCYDGKRHRDYSGFAGYHLGKAILLPPGAPDEYADECTFVMAVGLREVRANAQAGRTIDFSLPRAVSDELLLLVAAFAMANFVGQGMAVRIDIECPPASDDDRNPHCHAYLAQRYLDTDGFGKKGREWNQQFLRDGGRHVRAAVAARVTLACSLLGIAAYMDPRRNEARGLGPPEERIPAPVWRMHDGLTYVAPIEDLKLKRREKKLAEATSGLSKQANENSMPVVVRSAVTSGSLSDNERRRRINLVGTLVHQAGGEARDSAVEGRVEITSAIGGCMTFDGEIFSIEGTANSAYAGLIVELARALDWPALVVEGDTGSADRIIVAGIPQGMTAINICASDKAIDLIKNNYGHLIPDTIRPLDPRDVVGNGYKAKPESVDQADFVVPRPNSPRTDEDNRLQSGALLLKDDAADYALKGPVNGEVTAFDPHPVELTSGNVEQEELQQRDVLLSDPCMVGDQAFKV